ncbi:DUF927 domain-containing protein [Phenylobacterium sp.]|uniref:DUF927 domain-containing protein n=1 Tax=Phenylobacterium sp. TaxID=1871053 RepID=UPI0025D60417|nr:DUF927 domain-containing protein [Phenylobacterium sp.]MCA3741998.1 DUF927 domain-containing protein [Phenylobacterium sp.]
MSPVPEGAPARLDAHRKAGKPATWWAYRDASGALLHWVARFDLPDGGKDVRPLTIWRSPAGVLGWEWRGCPDPRPLYGLDRLAQAGPAAPVLLVEGEKAADLARELFPDMAVLTWQGGTNATGKADWRPLAGRRVVIWPDNDEPGQKAAGKALGMLRGVGAVGRVVEAPWADLPEAWDLADPFPSGFSLHAAQAAVSVALAAIPQPGAVEDEGGGIWPPGYRMFPDGLHRETDRTGGLEWVADSFEVLGLVHSPNGPGWGRRLRFRDANGRQVEHTVWDSDLVVGGTASRRELSGKGLRIKPAYRACHFVDAVYRLKPRHRYLSLSRTGWEGRPGATFVLPSEVIGRPTESEVIFEGSGGSHYFAKAGDREGWREGIAAHAVGNPLLAFGLSLAFLGPLARLMGWGGGGFHLQGASGAGKTTLAMAAGSVWGGGGVDGFIQTWRATDNALEGLAEAHNDTLLVLDELGQIVSEAIGSAVYTLANGQAKARAQAGGGNRVRAEWCVPFLSTGEKTLREHMAEAARGGDAKTGQEIRFLDLEADAGKGQGIWTATSGVSPGEMSDRVKAAAKAHFGWAGPDFVKGLVSGDLEALRAAALLTHRTFKDGAARGGDSPQIGRGADRFAQVAAAGELATAMGVLPWAPGVAAQAARNLFDRWAERFGRTHTGEERRVFEAARHALQVSGAKFARFNEETESESAQKDRDNWGWRGVIHQDGECFVVHKPGWQQMFKAVGGGERAAKVLKAAGFLVVETGETAGREGRLTRKFRSHGRCYWLRAAFLESDLGGG